MFFRIPTLPGRRHILLGTPTLLRHLLTSFTPSGTGIQCSLAQTLPNGRSWLTVTRWYTIPNRASGPCYNSNHTKAAVLGNSGKAKTKISQTPNHRSQPYGVLSEYYQTTRKQGLFQLSGHCASPKRHAVFLSLYSRPGGNRDTWFPALPVQSRTAS